MTTLADAVARLEAERLHPTPPPPNETFSELFRQLLDLIAAECRRAGYLPPQRRDIP